VQASQILINTSKLQRSKSCVTKSNFPNRFHFIKVKSFSVIIMGQGFMANGIDLEVITYLRQFYFVAIAILNLLELTSYLKISS